MQGITVSTHCEMHDGNAHTMSMELQTQEGKKC